MGGDGPTLERGELPAKLDTASLAAIRGERPMTILSTIAISTLAALATTARTAAETKRLARDIKEEMTRRREKEHAGHERLNKDIDEQLALTKWLSDGGRT